MNKKKRESSGWDLLRAACTSSQIRFPTTQPFTSIAIRALASRPRMVAQDGRVDMCRKADEAGVLAMATAAAAAAVEGLGSSEERQRILLSYSTQLVPRHNPYPSFSPLLHAWNMHVRSWGHPMQLAHEYSLPQQIASHPATLKAYHAGIKWLFRRSSSQPESKHRMISSKAMHGQSLAVFFGCCCSIIFVRRAS